MEQQEKIAYLGRMGFEDWEAYALAHETKYETLYRVSRGYVSRRDDPGVYIQRMIQSRRHNMRRWQAAKLSDREIHDRILMAYQTHDWFSHPKALKDATAKHRDPMAMLRWFRQRAIGPDEGAGEYRPKPRSRPGSRRTPRSAATAEKRLGELYGAKPSQVTNRRDARLKIDDYNQQINRASAKGNQKERRRLESLRNQWQMRLDRLA